jgi:hypothetical protein
MHEIGASYPAAVPDAEMRTFKFSPLAVQDAELFDPTSAPGSPATEAELEEQVFLLRFGNGDYDLFRAALRERPELRSCREALADAGHPLTEHGFIFVKPEQYPAVLQALTGIKLHPFHVIVAESLEPALEEAYKTLPYRKRPREKRADRQRLIKSLQNAQARRELLHAALYRDDQKCILTVERTFICTSPILRPASSVTQSTTELVVESSQYYGHYRGKNPRR